MELPQDNPELAEELNESKATDYTLGSAEFIPFTVEGFRSEILRLRRKCARILNHVRLARTFSTEAKVKTILEEAEGIE